MANENLQELFVGEVRNTYDAEEPLTKWLLRTAKAAESDDLRSAVEKHLEIRADAVLASCCAANVLITGGNAGTRFYLAERIHRADRLDGPLMAVTAVEHWNAVRGLPLATIFIDDVDRLTATQQTELLQMLEQNIAPGDRIRWRIIAASGNPLYEKVTKGGFEATLYYRLNVIHIAIPA
jgi:Sigma-54 interaction domain/Domain of unknown function (DUF892)